VSVGYVVVNFAFATCQVGLLTFFFFGLSKDDAMAYLLSRSCYIVNVFTYMIVVVTAPILRYKFNRKLSSVKTNTFLLKRKSTFTAALLTVCCLLRASYSTIYAVSIWTEGSEPVFVLEDISVTS
jgi:amino acid transporter